MLLKTQIAKGALLFIFHSKNNLFNVGITQVNIQIYSYHIKSAKKRRKKKLDIYNW